MDQIPLALVGLVALWLLRPLLQQAASGRPIVPPTPDVPRRRSAANAAVEAALEDEVGPYPRLATKVSELEHAFKALSNEWQDKESRMDSIIKRLHRFRKLEGIPDEQPANETPPAPVTREGLLAQFQRKQAQ